MNSIIRAKDLSKHYGKNFVLNDIDLTIGAGRIVGLLGPNGAGKTTALRCLLGLSSYVGELSVLGCDPKKERIKLIQDVAYIADTAVLPRWIAVSQLLDYMDGVHPKFNRSKAVEFLDQTQIRREQKVNQLSKGMITQLHLALAISIDAKLLVLDEPTLGLDTLYRSIFYQQLVNDYFDEERTILITTHHIEEVEHLLTDLIIVKNGCVILDMDMISVTESFCEIEVSTDNVEQLRRHKPISERSTLGGSAFIFENADVDQLAALGQLTTPSLVDLCSAKMA